MGYPEPPWDSQKHRMSDFSLCILLTLTERYRRWCCRNATMVRIGQAT